MESHKASLLSFLFIFTILFTSSTIQMSAALRPLQDNQLLKKSFPNLQRGPVPPNGPSPCSQIPGRGSQCKKPPANPRSVVDFSVEASQNEKNKHH
ncbi:hypothetical protein ACOSQ3_004117 [Xanthoceras sorbifolium]